MAENWKIKQKIDLSGAGKVTSWPETLMMPGDSQAHKWSVEVTDNNVPVSLTGWTVTGYFDLADGETVAVVGSVSGNTATVTMEVDCYTVPGAVRATMRMAKGTAVTTLSVLLLNVGTAPGDDYVDPGTVVPTLATLAADCEAATEAANTAAIAADTAAGAANTAAANVGGAIAPAYSSASTYALGAVCTYLGMRYKCTTAITVAEAWTAGHWTEEPVQTVLDEHDAQLAEDANTLAALNEDTYGYAHLTPQNRIEAVESEIRSDKVVLEYAWEQGYFNTTTGAETVSGNAIRTDFVASHDKQFINLEIAAGYRMFVFRYDASKVFISYSMIPGTTTDAVVEFDVAIGSGYYRLAMTKYDYALISVGAESNVVVSLFRSTFDQIQNRIAPVLFRDFGLGNRSNANQTGTTKMRVFPKFRCQDLVIAYSNYYKGTLNTPTANTNSITVKASVEINGVITPVFFGGKRSVVIEGGATVLSDTVGVIVEATDVVFVRTYFDAGSGGYIPQSSGFFGSVASTPNRDGVVYGSDLCDSGTVTEVSFTNVFTPTMILGVSNPWRKSYLLVGDSIMTVGGETITPCAAFAARKLYAQGIPYTKISMGGDLAAYFPTSLYIRAPFSKHHSGVICNFGANDLYGLLSSLATMKTALKKIWGYYAKLGMAVYQCTITPNTASTDLWMTLENQTVSNATQEAVRLALNTWLMDATSTGAVAESAGTLTGVFDTAATVETSGKWSVYDTPIFSGTVDSAGANYIIDAAITAASRAYDNTTVIKITGGTGAGQTRQVLNNATATQVYVNSNWTTQPDNTSTYEIYRVPTYDGVHPSMDAHGFMGVAVNVPAF